MKPNDLVTWHRPSGDVIARVVAVGKQRVTLDVTGVRVPVDRNAVTPLKGAVT